MDNKIIFKNFKKAIQCYTCDNFAFGEQCIDNPEDVPNGVATCNDPNNDACWTQRVEEPPNSKTMLKILVFQNVLKFKCVFFSRNYFEQRLLHNRKWTLSC